MWTPFTKYQTVEDISSHLDDENDLIYPICDNVLFLTKKCIDPFEDEVCIFDKNQATIVGLFMKQSYLFEEAYCSYKKCKINVFLLYQRIIFEAYLKMRYLIKYGEDAQREYRLYSFRSRKAFYDKYSDKNSGYFKVRNDKFVLDLADEGFTMDDLSEMHKSFGGKNMRQLTEEFVDNQSYSSIYGMGSDPIHSDWGDIRQLYLQKTEDCRYVGILKQDYKHFRMLIPMVHLIVESGLYYTEWLQTIDEYLKIVAGYKNLFNEMGRMCILIMKAVFNEYQNNPNKYMME